MEKATLTFWRHHLQEQSCRELDDELHKDDAPKISEEMLVKLRGVLNECIDDKLTIEDNLHWAFVWPDGYISTIKMFHHKGIGIMECSHADTLTIGHNDLPIYFRWI